MHYWGIIQRTLRTLEISFLGFSVDSRGLRRLEPRHVDGRRRTRVSAGPWGNTENVRDCEVLNTSEHDKKRSVFQLEGSHIHWIHLVDVQALDVDRSGPVVEEKETRSRAHGHGRVNSRCDSKPTPLHKCFNDRMIQLHIHTKQVVRIWPNCTCSPSSTLLYCMRINFVQPNCLLFWLLRYVQTRYFD